MQSNKTLILLLVALILVSALGIMHLLWLRYARGDVYPPYSSLRADPLGTKVLHDALKDLPGVSVRRNLRPLAELVDENNPTLLVIGSSTGELQHAGRADALEDRVLRGARVVIAFAPVVPQPSGLEEREDETADKEDAAEPTVEHSPEAPEEAGSGQRIPSRPSLMKRWHFRIAHAELPLGEDGSPRPEQARNAGVSHLPEMIPWHSGLYFEDLHQDWKVIYRRGDQPVLIERHLGRGTAVLCSDGYLLSNEAMLMERHPVLLSWLLGPGAEVVFDETVHGVTERPGIIELALRYRLHGLMAGVLVLTGLAVWRAGTRLVPPPEEPEGGGAVETVPGRDAAEGLTSLLRRSIPARHILRVCLEEWKREPARSRRIRPEDLDLLAAQSASPQEGYRNIHHLLLKTKGRHER
ncbi:MAG: DUF4350 domain-containing protein [Acidobacteriota bacterium]